MEELQEVLLVEISASCEVSDSVSQSLRGKVNATNSRNERGSEKQTICRVIKPLRELNPSAYEPRIASIGPYHHGKPSLVEMEKLKGGYLKKFLSRNPQTPLEDYITEVRRLEKRARGAYVEEFEMATDEFVEMMVLDGCFALELLLDKQWDHGLRNLNQNVFASLDLLLLENQVPFFMLQALFNLNQPTSSVNLCPRALVTIVYNGAHSDTSSSCNAAISIMSEKRGVDDVSHLLHLLYRVITRQRLQANKDPPRHWKLTAFLRVFMDKMKSLFGVIFPFSWVTETESENLDMTTIRCATKLKDAGITFKRKKNENNIFDITFEKGVLTQAPFLL